ncbi:serine/threonine-protein phosphatase 1 regulatory subunit 10 isoform X2 [Pogonomyrmex barbatus]|nr:serine/threonine-protein phosphatase 1 regulatory subunit 10 isoform X2 [Pogonomyrmex barbatus]XP_025073232.1 serine/threonine-protein phosphatase 1 regulatory subunit 10 isoform X2 [Pogonomyrmex barbatus]
MSAGGWNLIHTWLTDGILAKNWALIQELLELLLLCPVDIERLKSNNCPKLIKGLSKEGSHQGVRTLASRLVEQWLKIVKGEAAPNSVPAQIMTVSVQSNATVSQSAAVPLQHQQQQQQYSTSSIQQTEATEGTTLLVQDFKLAQQPTTNILVNQQEQEKQQQLQERLQPQTVQIVSKAQQAQVQQQVTQQQCKKQTFVVVPSSSLPVYKITIRDGNQVLAKVETDAANISNALNIASTSTEINGTDATQEVKPEVEELDRTEENNSAAGSRDDAIDVIQSDDSGHIPSEVKQTVISSKDNQDSESVKSKDIKDSKDIVSSDSGKSSDKENNRDSHKKDDKRFSSSSDKKSSSHHHGSSSSSSSSSKSSKHSTSSSTHRSSSTSHRSSSHRSSSSSSKTSSSSKDRSSKDKDKHHSSSSSKHSSSRSKSERDKEREKEKEKQKKDQAEKDKATLEKVQGQALSSKMGKIPKKRTEDEKSSDANGRKSSTESRDGSKENKEKADSKKDAVSTKLIAEKKNISISIENRKNNQNISISIENRKNSQDSGTRPKTVKTFNSKFRSTGLEEEVKPPPPRSKKANPVVDKKVLPPKLPLKRPSPLRDTVLMTEKRVKLSLDSPTTPPSDEKKGGIKLIPPKPKPMMLQESDMFMDALTASTKSKEPRKRKRRTSITKDGSSEAKKQEIATADNRESTPPPASPSNTEEKSVALKPNFKFYQDTLEIEEDKDQREKENEEESKKDKDQALDEEKDNRDDDDIGSNTPTPEEDVEDSKDLESPEDASSVISDSAKNPEIRYVDGLKSVLLLQKRKGPKKVLKWKTDLESIRYFELDETERVNVTKTFTDMKQMEKQNEREAFQMARKLNNEDLMEERTRWKPLIPIDLPPPLVEPGKDSKEKDIQYAREKGILQALYFNRSMIPDSAAEPDEERNHVMTDPKIIPLDDLAGNKESEKDFTAIPWPEPKPQPPQPPTVTTFHYPTTYPHNQQSMMTTMGPQSTMGPMPQMPQQMMAPTHMTPMSQEMTGPMPATGGGGWRTGDGKVLVPDVSMNPMANMSSGFNPGVEGGPMVPPGMMGPPPMYNQEGYGMMCPDEMGYNNFQGPPGPMYPGPGPNFPGPRAAHMHNRGRGGPGWGYRGPVRGGWRGVGGGGWRGSGKQPPVCRQFSKNGYCRVGDKCQYLHPGVNCPPF